MLIPIVQGGLSFSTTLVLDITSNAAEQNILTLATAAGYNAATDDRAIIVNIASGVTISGSSTHALRTGALNADSDLTINISGSVDGYTGADGGLVAQVGSVGGDALYWETLTGGSGTYIVNVLSGGNLRSGGGGGGGGGQRGARLASMTQIPSNVLVSLITVTLGQRAHQADLDKLDRRAVLALSVEEM